MPTADIADDDFAARLISFKQAFDNGVVRDEQLWQFTKVPSAKNRYETSVFLRRLLPNDNGVHEIGCKIAADQNAKRQDPPPGDENRRYYCGFSEAKAIELTLRAPNYSTELILKEELGIKAHIAFFLQTIDGTKLERGTIRTEALARLSAALAPIKLHRCAIDLHDKHHPTERFGLKCYGRLAPAA